MVDRVATGMVAGAAGTVALNIATYVDMALRGRPPSQPPAQVAGDLAQRVGIDLNPGDQESDEALAAAEQRRSGLGSLMGYVVGLGVGAGYGLVRPIAKSSLALDGAALGLAAMLASDAPSVALGKTNPATWGFAGWAADVVPHLAYGLVAAVVYAAFTDG